MISRRGRGHDSNQDAYFFREVGDFTVIAVMDGCSGGIDSQFASLLFKKILNHVTFQVLHSPPESNIVCLNIILERFYDTLHTVQRNLGLFRSELETTLTLVIINKECVTGCIFGDGWIKIDEWFYYNDQGNQPRYPAHYDTYERMRNVGYFFHKAFQDQVLIGTDGLFSWRDRNKNKVDVTEHFFFSQNFMGTYNKLTRLGPVDQRLYHDDDFTILGKVNSQRGRGSSIRSERKTQSSSENLPQEGVRKAPASPGIGAEKFIIEVCNPD